MDDDDDDVELEYTLSEEDFDLPSGEEDFGAEPESNAVLYPQASVASAKRGPILERSQSGSAGWRKVDGGGCWAAAGVAMRRLAATAMTVDMSTVARLHRRPSGKLAFRWSSVSSRKQRAEFPSRLRQSAGSPAAVQASGLVQG